MEEFAKINPEFLSGFNEGYKIAQHLPDLAEKLANAVGDNERGNGFKSGREQFMSEAKENRRPSWLKKDQLAELDKESSKEVEKNKDRDRDIDKA